MNYPTQEFIKQQIAAGRWPAREDEVLDIRSLSDREIKIIELYNQEEIIKQLRKLNARLEGSPKKSLRAKLADLMDDGELNDSI